MFGICDVDLPVFFLRLRVSQEEQAIHTAVLVKGLVWNLTSSA